MVFFSQNETFCEVPNALFGALNRLSGHTEASGARTSADVWVAFHWNNIIPSETQKLYWPHTKNLMTPS